MAEVGLVLGLTLLFLNVIVAVPVAMLACFLANQKGKGA